MSGGTRGSLLSFMYFGYRAFTFCGSTFQLDSSIQSFFLNCRPVIRPELPTTPIQQRLLPYTVSVWTLPRSLAATCGISFDFFSSGYLDVSVRRVLLLIAYFFQLSMVQVRLYRVSPFGYPRIYACLQLPEAFRRLLRPSSSPGA